jgi:hypothetical protein
MTRKKLYTQLALIGLILITLSIYFPPFDWAFVGDDYVQFDYIKAGMANPWAFFSLLNPYETGWYYRPLQLIWFGLLEIIFHYLPNGYYWVALLFHVLTVSVVYRVARQFKLGAFTAVLIATLFAIHSHWVDVVSWLSSIAIVQSALFSLLTVSAWLSYLKRPSNRQILLTLLFCLLTFWSHEESILLPPFLLLLLLADRLDMDKRRSWREKITHLITQISQKERFVFIGLALFTLAYLVIQFTRPNLTVDISSRETAEWFTYFTWPEIAEFVIVTVFRFTFISSLLNLSGTAASLFVLAVFLLLGVWFWRGNHVVRLGLAWLLLHLTFIYLALWTQLPLLYAGRHIYQGMFGLILASGATLEMILVHYFSPQRARRTRRKKAQPTLRPQQWANIALLVAVTAVSLHHLNHIRQTQQQWLDDVVEEATVKEHLADLFPTISPESHFFAVRFPIAPQFTRTVMQVWYDMPLERPGGSLDHLRAANPITRDFVVLDYANGQVYNLMPELQQHDETRFLWTEQAQQVWLNENGTETALPQPEATLPIVAAPNGSQIALKLTPENGRWLSHKISLNLPINSVLETAVLPQSGLHYRLRLQTNSGETRVLYETSGDEAPEWQPISLPLGLFSDTIVTLHFEVLGENLAENSAAYWANPRLVLDGDR